MDNFRIGLI